MPGWSDQTASDQFDAEYRVLFSTAEWEVHPGRDGICDTVTKEDQGLYLHPQSFSGVIREDEVQPIKELLAKAKTFQCYHVDFYKEYLDINDDEYWALLESRREENHRCGFGKLQDKAIQSLHRRSCCDADC
ncbi:MAG: hypothetical protein HDT19_02835 [Oscillibacter sp.]|nr:hypothetical protein [Oscillibacter sp.]